MDPPLLLYSAGTWLAFAIAERFYGGVHYVWCSPFYDGSSAARHYNVPPSSSPAEIYRALAEDTRRGDLHSEAIDRNRKGILRGARAKRDRRLITDDTYEEIGEMVEKAPVAEFRPILYVIPFARVRRRVVEVGVHERAHLLSREYRVEALPRGSFDMIEIRR